MFLGKSLLKRTVVSKQRRTSKYCYIGCSVLDPQIFPKRSKNHHQAQVLPEKPHFDDFGHLCWQPKHQTKDCMQKLRRRGD